jgi:Ulp1 family protease
VQLGEQQKLMKLLGEKADEVVLDTFISGSSAKIFVSNLVCVFEGQWLNSETINVYVLMIEAAAKSAAQNIASFSSYFVTKIETEVNRIYTFDMCGDVCDV